MQSLAEYHHQQQEGVAAQGEEGLLGGGGGGEDDEGSISQLQAQVRAEEEARLQGGGVEVEGEAGEGVYQAVSK